MTPAAAVRRVRDLVATLTPVDDLAALHRAEALAWLSGTDDVYRRVKPATPDPHLVSYVVPVDPATGDVLLLEHVTSGLWLAARRPTSTPTRTRRPRPPAKLPRSSGSTATQRLSPRRSSPSPRPSVTGGTRT